MLARTLKVKTAVSTVSKCDDCYVTLSLILCSYKDQGCHGIVSLISVSYFTLREKQ